MTTTTASGDRSANADENSVDATTPHRKNMQFSELLENNKKWALKLAKQKPGFFATLAKQQNPELLWIGCSDSRVPANQLLKLLPGEVFVHRNIANCINHTDLNSLSVIQYAVDVLKVKHVIVCGHYGCGGVAAALSNQQFGLIDNWLRGIKDVYDMHKKQLDKHGNNEQDRLDHLVELNVARSVENVCHTTIIQNAWARGQEVNVYGWCYRLDNGIIQDLKIQVSNADQVKNIYTYVTSDSRQ